MKREGLRVRVSMATVPERESLSFQRAARSIAGQLQPGDRFHVLLSGHSRAPEFLCELGADVRLSPKRYGCEARFWWVLHEPLPDVVEMMVDDDIEYPPDYIEKMVEAVERHERKALLCVFGKLLSRPVTTVEKSTLRWFGFDRALGEDTPVHVPGMGTSAWHSSSLAVSFMDLTWGRNMTDLQIGLLCREQNVPVIAVKRAEGWLRALPTTPGIHDRIREPPVEAECARQIVRVKEEDFPVIAGAKNYAFFGFG